MCATGNAATFAPDCTIERTRADNKTILVIRHKDGGFRRFEVLGFDGGLVSADGADAAIVVADGNNVLVTVESDQYRIPVAASANQVIPSS